MTGDSNSRFSVRFWGVRGSISTADGETSRYGGNTSSLEVRCGERTLLFDAGTGIRYVGKRLASAGAVDADLFLTHTHYDHICGIPFFLPFFIPGNRFRVWAGHLLPDLDVRTVLTELMMAPLFPVPPEIFAAQLEFKDFTAGEAIELGDGISIRTVPLNHPNGATGYRIEYDGRSICYLTDTEHRKGQRDQRIIELIRGTDLVVYDAMYTDAEYEKRVGWGHSTWEEGVRLCEAADAGRYVVFHHDPDHDDEFLDGVAREVEAMRPGSMVAREGMVLEP